MTAKTKDQLRKEIDKELNEEVNGSPLWECARGREIIHELGKDLTSDRLIEIKLDVKQMLFDSYTNAAGSSTAEETPADGIRQRTEFRLCRYEFNREEKAVIAGEMAEAVSKVAKKTDELKSVKSQIQSDIDAAQATLRQKAEHLRSGFELRSLECQVRKFPKEKLVRWYRIDTMEIAHERKMRPDELQEKLPLETA
jgi:hypothetical protein